MTEHPGDPTKGTGANGNDSRPPLYELFLRQLVNEMAGPLSDRAETNLLAQLDAAPETGDSFDEAVGSTVLQAYRLARDAPQALSDGRNSRVERRLGNGTSHSPEVRPSWYPKGNGSNGYGSNGYGSNGYASNGYASNGSVYGSPATLTPDQEHDWPTGPPVLLEPPPGFGPPGVVGPRIAPAGRPLTVPPWAGAILTVGGNARTAVRRKLPLPGEVDQPALPLSPEVVAAEAKDRQRARLITASTWVRNIGALLILFAAWQVWGTSLQEHADQHALATKFTTDIESSPSTRGSTTGHITPPTQLLAPDVIVPQPAEDALVARLSIPAISLSQYVVQGTGEPQLAMGPGHYVGTSMPGQSGNVAIAGHRTTHGAPFNHLDELKVGDPIYLTTTSGQLFTYIVSQPPFPVSPNDVAVLDNFGDNRLTLTTCNPKFSAAQRLIVVATYHVPPGQTTSTTVPPGAKTVNQPVHQRIQSGGENGWDWAQLPLTALLFAALISLGLFYKRLRHRYGRLGSWLVLLPIWLAGLYLVFQTLTNLLPASF